MTNLAACAMWKVARLVFAQTEPSFAKTWRPSEIPSLVR
jgi:hypothetical protein